jgi:aspartate-semialdehyde dehydrogenase
MMTDRIDAVVLGATGIVGQHLVAALQEHPWFRVSGLCASTASAGIPYGDAVGDSWSTGKPLRGETAAMTVRPCDTGSVSGRIAFSALGLDVAGPVERAFAEAGYIVCSNAGAHRMEKDVPLVIPEVNADHLTLLERQNFGAGGIVTNPNCSTVGLVLTLAPLHRRFGLRSVNVVTMQSMSGAGLSGLSAIAIHNNCLPFIAGEEDKIVRETARLLGSPTQAASLFVSARCHRVPVSVGHLLSVDLRLESDADSREIIECWESFTDEEVRELPSAPEHTLIYRRENDRPQPQLDRNAGDGMTVTLGRLRKDGKGRFGFNALVNNLVRGAAGAALLNAELLVKRGFVR